MRVCACICVRVGGGIFFGVSKRDIWSGHKTSWVSAAQYESHCLAKTMKISDHVIQQGWCLSHLSIDVKRHHDQGNGEKKAFNLELMVPESSRSMTIMAGNTAAGKQAWLWSLAELHKQEAERGRMGLA